MQKAKRLLNKVGKCGFKGIKPLYLEFEESASHEEYALFYLEFEKNEPDISDKFEQYLIDKFDDCEIIVRGTEYEIIGPDFYEVEDVFYDDYLLVDDLW